MKIHTIGCSFTNYIYPTWSDYIAKFYNVDVENLGYPSQGNETIKKHLYTIDESDHVIIMFSGYNRITAGVDQNHLLANTNDVELLEKVKKNKQNFFRNNLPFTSFVSLTSKLKQQAFSQFHMMYHTLETIFECQTYLQNKKIDYTFCFWQGFDNDVTVIRSEKQPKINCDAFMENRIYNRIDSLIDKNKFVQNFSYGLWEHTFTNRELVMAQSTIDLHPSTLCHFDFFKTYLKPILDKKINNGNDMEKLFKKAKNFSKIYASMTLEQINQIYRIHDYPDLTVDDFNRARNHFFLMFDNLPK